MEVADLLELYPNAIEKAKEMLEEALGGGGKSKKLVCDDLCSVLAYRIALAVVAASKSNWVKNSFAVMIAKKASARFKEEDIKTVVSIMNMCGFKVELLNEPLKVPLFYKRGAIYEEEYPARLDLTEYVRLAKRFLSDKSWKVVNKALMKGKVYLKNDELLRLAEEAVVSKVVEDVKELGDVDPESLPESIKPLVELIKKRVAKRETRFAGAPKGFVQQALPPCIKVIYEKALQGDNLSHQERFTLATFLLNLGKSVDEVLEIFKNMPDYSEKIARYQVEHLAGLRGSHKKYKPPSCETLVSWGLCPDGKDCVKKHPLSEYYRRLAKLTKAPSQGRGPSRRGAQRAP